MPRVKKTANARTDSRREPPRKRPSEVVWPTAAQITSLQRDVFRWFASNARDLPWRHDITPYRIWISEIMLQQTQVVTVMDYWRRFLQRFPTVKHLADAPLDDVLKLWEGLGYYRRARQLHAAAKQVVDHHDGEFPTRMDQVLALPGIGRYTAGAILSIATNQPHPILEGNTIRLYSRLLGLASDPTRGPNQKLLWNFAQAIVPQHQPGTFNQGLMEIGGQVCRLAEPRCDQCPVAAKCQARIRGLQDRIPAPREKRVHYQTLVECLALIQRGDRYLCRQSSDGERWAGLWDFVRVDLTELSTDSGEGFEQQDQQLKREVMTEAIRERTGLTTELESCSWSIRHAVTRFRIQLSSVRARKIRGRVKRDSGFQWLTESELRDRAFNVTARKFIDHYFASETS